MRAKKEILRGKNLGFETRYGKFALTLFCEFLLRGKRFRGF